REGGNPRKLSEEEAKLAPPATGGHYTKDKKRVVFADAGEIVLQDTVTGKRTPLVRSVEAESAPRFARDERHVTFVRGSNLYRLSLESGELEQLTDIRQGPERPEPKLTESQRFVAAEQKQLFEVVRERAAEKERAEARRKTSEKRKPHYLPARATAALLEL